MKVVLAVLVGSFEFGKVPGWEMEKYSLITLRPKHGMYLHVKKVEEVRAAQGGIFVS
jgi:hypothetical protein